MMRSPTGQNRGADERSKHTLNPLNVIIDTDPGVDDLLAILLALNSSELHVDALTTLGGNCSLADATRNALRTLEVAARPDIPVYKGAARPLKGRYVYARYFHGPRGLTGRLPEPRLAAVDDLDAVDAIASRIESARTPTTLVALGPLTNVARLIMRHPDAANGISTLIVMGGAVDVPGNVTPYAEFNTFSDPEAADIVFRSGLNVQLIGLDVCNPVFLERHRASRINRRQGTRRARLVRLPPRTRLDVIVRPPGRCCCDAAGPVHFRTGTHWRGHRRRGTRPYIQGDSRTSHKFRHRRGCEGGIRGDPQPCADLTPCFSITVDPRLAYGVGMGAGKWATSSAQRPLHPHRINTR